MSALARASLAWTATNAAVLALLALRAHTARRRTTQQAARARYTAEALALATAAAITARPHPALTAAMHRHPSAPGHAAAQLDQHLHAGCDGSCPTALNLLWLTGTAPQSEQRA